jgi:hypothetical protein
MFSKQDVAATSDTRLVMPASSALPSPTLGQWPPARFLPPWDSSEKAARAIPLFYGVGFPEDGARELTTPPVMIAAAACLPIVKRIQRRTSIVLPAEVAQQKSFRALLVSLICTTLPSLIVTSTGSASSTLSRMACPQLQRDEASNSSKVSSSNFTRRVGPLSAISSTPVD